MSHTELVGIIPDITLLADAQSGVHYARHVLLLGLSEGDPLPPVGRGKAVAASSWRSHINRATVVVGPSDYLLSSLHDLRSAVVLVATDDGAGVMEQATKLASYREVHLVTSISDAIRVIIPDAAQIVVQAHHRGYWQVVDTFVETATPKRTRNGRHEPSTTTADVTQTAGDTPSLQVMSDEVADITVTSPDVVGVQETSGDVDALQVKALGEAIDSREQLPPPPDVIVIAGLAIPANTNSADGYTPQED